MTEPIEPTEERRIHLRRSHRVECCPRGPELARDTRIAVTLFLHRGSTHEDVERITAALRAHGAWIVSVHEPSRRIKIRISAFHTPDLFGTTLYDVSASEHEGHTRQRSGKITLPQDLRGVSAVLGLDDRPVAKPRIARSTPGTPGNPISYTPLEIAEIYQIPEGTGAGQRIAIIELGGGFLPSDFDAYFASLSLATPSISVVEVDGALNTPGVDLDADGEVALDVEVIGALVPEAELSVYFAPNTLQGFIDGVAEAVFTTPPPVAISISWGESEDIWPRQGLQIMDEVLEDATNLGITVTTAAGDHGAVDNDPNVDNYTGIHVDFPSSSPHVLSCGGTNLVVNDEGKIVETVWNSSGNGGVATGGGVSDRMPILRYQSHLGLVSRAVPDVCGVADPDTGWQIYVHGAFEPIGGTSAVAPMWAAIVARLVQASGQRFGLINSSLYRTRPIPSAEQPDWVSRTDWPAYTRQVTIGNNGYYEADLGYNECTGLGSPSPTLAYLEPYVADTSKRVTVPPFFPEVPLGRVSGGGGIFSQFPLARGCSLEANQNLLGHFLPFYEITTSASGIYSDLTVEDATSNGITEVESPYLIQMGGFNTAQTYSSDYTTEDLWWTVWYYSSQFNTDPTYYTDWSSFLNYLRNTGYFGSVLNNRTFAINALAEYSLSELNIPYYGEGDAARPFGGVLVDTTNTSIADPVIKFRFDIEGDLTDAITYDPSASTLTNLQNGFEIGNVATYEPADLGFYNYGGQIVVVVTPMVEKATLFGLGTSDGDFAVPNYLAVPPQGQTDFNLYYNNASLRVFGMAVPDARLAGITPPPYTDYRPTIHNLTPLIASYTIGVASGSVTSIGTSGATINAAGITVEYDIVNEIDLLHTLPLLHIGEVPGIHGTLSTAPVKLQTPSPALEDVAMAIRSHVATWDGEKLRTLSLETHE